MADSTVVELTRELLRVRGKGLLDEDLDRLDDERISRPARYLFSRFREAYGGKTLRGALTDSYFSTWLDESCSRSDQDALVYQLRIWIGIRVTQAGGVDDPSRLVALERVPTEYVKLLRWAEEYNVVNDLHRPAEELVSDRPELTAGVSLLEAALQPGELRCSAQMFLEHKAAAARGPAARRRLWLRAKPGETLSLLCTRLRELTDTVPLSEIERWQFVATQPVTVDVVSGLCRGVLMGVPRIEVELDLGSYEQRALAGTCALCSGSRCIHVAALAARLLDACLDATDRLTDPLTTFASSPTWRRFLEAAMRSSSPPGVTPLRYVLEIDGPTLKLGVLRESKDGEKPKLAAPLRLLRKRDLDERDRSVVAAMARVARTRGPEKVWVGTDVLRALAGHARIERASNGASVRLVERRLHVSFLSRPDGIVPQVQLSGYPISARSNGYVFVESPARDALVFAVLTPAIERLLDALERFQGALPPESYAALAPWIASLREQVELTLPDTVSGKEEPAPDKLLLRVHAFEDEGCEILVGVRAFPLSPVWPPGRGDEVEHGVVAGRPVFCRRDFGKERELEAQALAVLELTGEEGRHVYTVHTDEQALHVLERAARASALFNIEWTEHDRRIRAVGKVRANDLHIKLKRVGSAFTVDGSAAFDAQELSFRRLLTAAIESKRFVRIRDRDHVEIEHELIERLRSLRYSVPLSERELHVIVAGAKTVLDTFGPQVAAEDAVTEDWLARLRQVPLDSEALDDLALTGQLRPYQLEGARWLIQCSAWAGGACLADEMGLGKTIQAIAVLLQRSAAGPALVVAPTSVLANWAAELTRFAPNLRTVIYRGAERRTVLGELVAGTVLVTSYNIALRDREQLASVRFATQVLDEAQTVRNARTKSAQALKAIAADFRIALTGTPIENRLADLWSVFDLIAPGLLGSWKAFRTLVGVPLERERNNERAGRLRAVISPLFLRRTKAEVGGDLPARIETVRRVALSLPEQALYRTAVKRARLALRRNKEELAQHSNSRDAERNTSIRLLAELTRLRQLACHARLVLADERVESSKLATLMQLLADILPRGHRVLIFSSFTSLLALVRDALNQRNISHLYLDGATPGAARGALVDRFQAGEGDVFLISLKAGGTGLNLTAADYVVHLDPWWNPAAQSQASDRAHRIGQTRPVTIVKLVAEGTIEERMLELQEHKRWLADAVLMADEASSRPAWELLEALLE